ncbi:MAG: hypothetical protein H0V55_03445 [Thermoleophilaceae bacterium]|jgi:tetratricopeptide (TPR) repeat protein|nr:hypothetical protein [Thermoleophilaceae bacterium]MBA3840060.1 hypothetical protein [Thermoleophilaceae bacterium]
MSSGGSTDARAAGGHAPARNEVAAAVELVGEADDLVSEALKPGRWPQRRTVERFLEEDRLERVLTLYGRAMRLDPDEPAYPWNLASALNRLGLNDLSLGFMTRAIHAAHRIGDEDWCGPDAYLALAEIAIDADEGDIALTALARAQELGGEAVDREIVRLLREVRSASRESRPETSLAGRLERLSAA